MSPMTPMDYFEQGYYAGMKNLPITACTLMFKAWPYDAWCLGWQLAQVERQASAKPWPGFTSDALPENVKTPFEQGQVAKLKGIALDDNPYEPTSRDWTGWRNGWVENLPEPTCSYAWPIWWKPVSWLVGGLALWAIIIALAIR